MTSGARGRGEDDKQFDFFFFFFFLFSFVVLVFFFFVFCFCSVISFVKVFALLFSSSPLLQQKIHRNGLAIFSIPTFLFGTLL